MMRVCNRSLSFQDLIHTGEVHASPPPLESAPVNAHVPASHHGQEDIAVEGQRLASPALAAS